MELKYLALRVTNLIDECQLVFTEGNIWNSFPKALLYFW